MVERGNRLEETLHVLEREVPQQRDELVGVRPRGLPAVPPLPDVRQPLLQRRAPRRVARRQGEDVDRVGQVRGVLQVDQLLHHGHVRTADVVLPPRHVTALTDDELLVEPLPHHRPPGVEFVEHPPPDLLEPEQRAARLLLADPEIALQRGHLELDEPRGEGGERLVHVLGERPVLGVVPRQAQARHHRALGDPAPRFEALGDLEMRIGLGDRAVLPQQHRDDHPLPQHLAERLAVPPLSREVPVDLRAVVEERAVDEDLLGVQEGAQVLAPRSARLLAENGLAHPALPDRPAQQLAVEPLVVERLGNGRDAPAQVRGYQLAEADVPDMTDRHSSPCFPDSRPDHTRTRRLPVTRE